MQPQPYTPSTIAFIRKEAGNGRSIHALSDMLGWTVTRLREICDKHQVTFSAPPIPDAKPDVGRKRTPGPSPSGLNRFSAVESINVRFSAELGERLKRCAERDGIPLSRYCGNIIAKAMRGEEQQS